jgi:hypothetical protein
MEVVVIVAFLFVVVAIVVVVVAFVNAAGVLLFIICERMTD